MALDFHPPGKDPLEWWRRLLEEVGDLVAGVKIGLPAFFKVGVDGVLKLMRQFSGNVYFLSDFKLADIPEVVSEEIKRLSSLGFSGSIVHLFPMGYEPVVDVARKLGHEIFGVAYMSHRGCRLFKESFQALLDYALALGVDGVIVGANSPDKILEARRRLGDKVLILSPGIGAQGVRPGAAIRAGADFEIIGRAITLSPEPRQAVIKIAKAQKGVEI